MQLVMEKIPILWFITNHLKRLQYPSLMCFFGFRFDIHCKTCFNAWRMISAVLAEPFLISDNAVSICGTAFLRCSRMVVPLGFEPRSGEPESSMMDRYTKGLCTPVLRCLFQLSGNSHYYLTVIGLLTIGYRLCYEENTSSAFCLLNCSSRMYGFK